MEAKAEGIYLSLNEGDSGRKGIIRVGRQVAFCCTVADSVLSRAKSNYEQTLLKNSTRGRGRDVSRG